MNMLKIVYGMVCVVVWVVNGADVGAPCQVARSGAQGVCQFINSCQPVIDDIVKKGLFPAQCGFRGQDQIVCCPVPATTTTTTTLAPTRISQRSKWFFYRFGFFLFVCLHLIKMYNFLITECKQYEDAKYETYWSGGMNDKPVMQKIPRCTTASIPNVVGGETANPNEFPHMVNYNINHFDPLVLSNHFNKNRIFFLCVGADRVRANISTGYYMGLWRIVD